MFYSCDSKCAVYSASEVIINSSTAVCVSSLGKECIYPYMGIPENKDITMKAVKLMLGHYISRVMNAGYTALISGLTEETELWAAEYVLKRKRYKPSKLIGVMPFLRHSEGMNSEVSASLRNIELHADLLITSEFICPAAGDTDALYRVRNCCMIDNSDVTIAFFDGKNYTSGTGQAVRYAEQRNKQVYMFGMNDVYTIMERAGMDENAIRAEIGNIKLKVPEPRK